MFHLGFVRGGTGKLFSIHPFSTLVTVAGTEGFTIPDFLILFAATRNPAHLKVGHFFGFLHADCSHRLLKKELNADFLQPPFVVLGAPFQRMCNKY